jgi:hypothetical protein
MEQPMTTPDTAPIVEVVVYRDPDDSTDASPAAALTREFHERGLDSPHVG